MEGALSMYIPCVLCVDSSESNTVINPLPTIDSVLTKQKAIYTVFTPSIKSPI